METWQTRATTGKHPSGLYGGACTSTGHNVYLYGGHNDSGYDGSFHQLDIDSLEWAQLPSGPMRKCGCGMVSYEDKLILFGGFGTPSGPIQPGAQFIEDREYNDGRGWTNELHMFDIQKSEGCYLLRVYSLIPSLPQVQKICKISSPQKLCVLVSINLCGVC